MKSWMDESINELMDGWAGRTCVRRCCGHDSRDLAFMNAMAPELHCGHDSRDLSTIKDSASARPPPTPARSNGERVVI